MTSLCKQIADDEIELFPICIENHWIFENLDPIEIKALSHEALRKKAIRHLLIPPRLVMVYS